MILDIIFVIILALAILHGFQRGLIVGLFSFVAIIVGLAAAIKLSAIVAAQMQDSVNISREWVPVISFFLVFIGVIILVRLGAKLIEAAVQVAMLGWVNRLGGIIFFTALYISVFSVLVFYAYQLGFLTNSAVENSVTYAYISPWGPGAVDLLGSVAPGFADMFAELENFFGNTASPEQ